MMSTARLREIYTQEIKHRKFVCVMNDVVKSQQDQLDGYLDKEKDETRVRMDKSIVDTRKTIVRQRVLKKCMKQKVEDLEKTNATKLYGKYRGIPVETFTGQIDVYLEENHPRVRRKQKIQELFDEGLEKGAILDKKTIKEKITDYFKTPLIQSRLPSQRRDKLPSILPAIDGFYTGDIKASENRAEFVTKRTRERKENDTDPNGGETTVRLFTKARRYRRHEQKKDEKYEENIVHSAVPKRRQPTDSETDESKRPQTLPPIKVVSETPSSKEYKDVKDSLLELSSRISEKRELSEKMNEKKDAFRKISDLNDTVRRRKIKVEKLDMAGKSTSDSDKENRDNKNRRKKTAKEEKLEATVTSNDYGNERSEMKEILSKNEEGAKYSLPPLKKTGPAPLTEF
ncbi:hypothetical protein CHS0354_022988 [Potamilus streckersoni]|uniref:Uncharacterized protein n=1 Tax=Potamilus streckersoni TaxID=2493646 RepID=A0AAE0SB72_9BIVA|nr:hypothetical protein CHS0354_022988 [Potamilus streckersoni]